MIDLYASACKVAMHANTVNRYHTMGHIPYGWKFWWEFILAVCLISVFGGIYFGGLAKACAIMICIAKWLTQTNSARLLKSL